MNRQNGHTRSSEPFFLPGGEPGVMLIHGFLTSPDEMRPPGESLAAAGMTVLGIHLTGHDTHTRDLRATNWQDWRSDARKGLSKLRQTCSRVCVAGLSLGGALALYTAALFPVERVVTFAAPDSDLAKHPLRRFLKPIVRVIRTIPKIGSDVRDPAARREHFTYRRVPLRQLLQISELLSALEEKLPRVKAPTMLVHARHDQVIPPATAERLVGKLGGPTRIFWVERGGHSVIVDVDREIVFAEMLAWLRGDRDTE